MTIQTTLGALVQAEPALQAICALSLSAKSAYHLKKLTTLVAAETKHFHEARDRAITELGTARDGGGFAIAPGTPAYATFVAQVTDLASVPVEIPWGPITLDMLGDEKVSAAQLLALGPLCAELEGTDPT